MKWLNENGKNFGKVGFYFRKKVIAYSFENQITGKNKKIAE